MMFLIFLLQFFRVPVLLTARGNCQALLKNFSPRRKRGVRRASSAFADPAFAAASTLRSRATAEDGSAE